MVLLVMAIAATLAAPAFARLGADQPQRTADRMIALLRDSRIVALQHNATAMLRLDPKTLNYELDTSGLGGFGAFTTGHLDLGVMGTLLSDQPRLLYVFRSSGASFADTVVVRDEAGSLVVRVDPWSGVARADSR